MAEADLRQLGYRAPRNTTIVSILRVSALLIAVSTYLVLDMDVAFSGPIQVSAEKLQRAVVEMQRSTPPDPASMRRFARR